jgi:hypothetical protein
MEYSLVLLCIARLLRCGEVFEMLEIQVSFNFINISLKYYLLVSCRECLPLIIESFVRIYNRNALHVSTCPSFFRECCHSIHRFLWNTRILDRRVFLGSLFA